MIRTVFLLLPMVLSMQSIGVAEPSIQIEALGYSDLDAYIDKIQERGDGLTFRRSIGSESMLCQIGSGELFVSKPSSILELQYGSHLILRNKTSELKFLTSPELNERGIRNAFLVLETKLQPGTDHQIIRVGVAKVSYNTGQMPSQRRLEIVDWLSIHSVADLKKIEKNCADLIQSRGGSND